MRLEEEEEPSLKGTISIMSIPFTSTEGGGVLMVKYYPKHKD